MTDNGSATPLPYSRSIDFIVAGREEVARNVLTVQPHVLISIRDPRRRKAVPAKNSARRGELFLAFHDAEPVSTFQLPRSIRLMSRKQAQDIWTFVLGHLPHVQAIVVQCEAGISRSPAIAAGLATVINGHAGRLLRDYQPNAYVLRLMIDTAPGQAPGR